MNKLACIALAVGILLTGLHSHASVDMCGTTYYPENSYKNNWDASINSTRVCPIASSFESELSSYYGFRSFAGSACSSNSAKGRMMDALWVLKNAAPGTPSFSYTPTNSGILMWAYKWSADQTSILEPTCNSNTHFQKKNSGFPFYRNTYYMRFNGDWLFNGNLVERAAVIVHEARHRQVGHSSDSSCPRGGSCDTAALGSNEYQRIWLEWFAVDSNSLFTNDMAQLAGDAANALAATAFSSPRTPLTLTRTSPLARESFLARGTERPRPYVAPPAYTKVCEFNDPSTGTTPGCTQRAIGGSGYTIAYDITKDGQFLVTVAKNTEYGNCTISISGSNTGYSVDGDCNNFRVNKYL